MGGHVVNDVTTASVLCATTALATITVVMPRPGDVLRTHQDAPQAMDVHVGAAVGSTISLAAGMAGSVLVSSPWPIIATLLAVILAVGAYETVLHIDYRERNNIHAHR